VNQRISFHEVNGASREKLLGATSQTMRTWPT